MSTDTDTPATTVANALGLKYRHHVVPIELLHANPWNPNKMDDRTRAATRESIATYGFIDPVTVRAHPDLEGHYQVIDGEHRWAIAGTELGYVELPVVELLDCPDVVAQKLTIVQNETRGEADSVLLGGLLAQIQAEVGPEQMRVALRYDDGELKHLLDMAGEDWDRFSRDEDPAPPPDPDDDGGEWFTLTCRLPGDAREVWAEATTRVAEQREGLHDDEKIANGQVVELLCAEYLSNPGTTTEP